MIPEDIDLEKLYKVSIVHMDLIAASATRIQELESQVKNLQLVLRVNCDISADGFDDFIVVKGRVEEMESQVKAMWKGLDNHADSIESVIRAFERHEKQHQEDIL